MRKILKYIFIVLSKRFSFIDNFYKNSSLLRTPVGLILLNFLCQRVFRVNGEARVPVNFTSRVTAYKKIQHYKDKNTLLSFAVSGGLYIQAINGIIMGRNVLIAPGVKIISANHDSKNLERSVTGKEIRIGDNVWIGANAIILPGVEIAEGCIIGAGAVVTRDFLESNSIIIGSPARVAKKNAMLIQHSRKGEV